MYKLWRAILIATAALCCLCACRPVSAQDYCSLRVRVVTPAGVRIPVSITVYEKTGRTIEIEQSSKEDAQFCDLGILPVKVVVGTKGCHEIVLDDVRNYWREPYTLTVTYDPEHCMRETPPPPKPLCELLFRIAGPRGTWINNATVRFEKSSLQPRQTDSAGRALVVIGLDNNIQGLVSAPGFVSKRFSVACTRPGVQEQSLSLLKK